MFWAAISHFPKPVENIDLIAKTRNRTEDTIPNSRYTRYNDYAKNTAGERISSSEAYLQGRRLSQARNRKSIVGTSARR